MRDLITRGLLALAVVSGITTAGAKLPSAPQHSRDAAFVPEPGLAKLLALGFDAVMSDVHWLRAVQVVGSDEGPVGRSDLLAALIEVVTTLDPWVDHPYRFAGVWLTDDASAVRRANAILRRGIAHHPDDWRGYFYLSFNHFFYLNEPAEAARALEPAIHLDGAPAYLERLLARLKGETGGLESAAAFLSELAAQATTYSERKHYEAALLEVETERRARFLDAARLEYVRRKKHDLARVEDLVAGGVLRALPDEPHGAEWTLDESTGQIVSSAVRFRYGVKIDGTSQKELERFRERSRAKREG